MPEDVIAAISSYPTEHINRFGDSILSLARKPPQPDYGHIPKRTASTVQRQMVHSRANRCHTSRRPFKFER